MKLSVELFKSKLLSNNEYPIMIRVFFNGKNKYHSLGISTKQRFWNKAKSCVYSRDSEYKFKNKIIENEYNRIFNRINYFIDNNIDLDINFIFSKIDLDNYTDKNIDTFRSSNFIDIIELRIKLSDKLNTRKFYENSIKVLKKLYGNYIDIKGINQFFVNDLRNKLVEFGYSDNHKNNVISCFNSTYSFGVKNNIIHKPCYYTLKLFAQLKSTKNDVSPEELSAIINCYKKNLSINGVETSISVSLFMLFVAFQGIAPVDICNLKIKDLSLLSIKKKDINYELELNDKDYINNINQEERLVIKIKSSRTKSHIPFYICCDFISIYPILYYFCVNKSKDDYLINCYSINKKYSEQQIENRRSSYFQKLVRELNKELELYCTTFKKTKLHRITYYASRHAFVNYLDVLDVPHDVIRKLIGHSTAVLEKNYINTITDWEQSDITIKLFNNVKSIVQIMKEKIGEDNVDKQIKELIDILS